ncbi:MAG: hypothetical protein JWP84_3071 [Tardiphaga sp.]|nr:hypothetical protein [Tardiphaga sp.]
MSTSGDTHFREAIGLLQAGRLEDAERRFKKVLRQQPKNIAALNLLSVVLSQLKRYAEVEGYIKSALQLDASSDATFYNYGIALKALNRPKEALQRFNEALALNPSIAETWNNCGTVLNDLKRYEDAIEKFDKAIGLRRDYAEAIYNRGNALTGLRRHDEALAAYDAALALKPDFAEVWLGRGQVFSDMKRDLDARNAYRRAIALKPDLAEALSALAGLSLLDGNISEALDLSRRALALNESPETKAVVAACLQSPLLLLHPSIGDLRPILLRAVSEAWARPSTLAPACAHFVVLNEAIRNGMAKLADPKFRSLPAAELVGSSGIAGYAEDPLLRAALEATPVSNAALERFVTELRFVLLTATRIAGSGAVPNSVLALYSAVARQCFINSYVFAQSDAEIEQVQALRDALTAKLASGAAVPALSLLAVAAYAPLHMLPGVESVLSRRWPDSVDAVLTQQVRDCFEEQRLRSSMPALTPIEDDVSIKVRSHYEEHPYPQWLKTDPVGEPTTIDAFMHEMFPASPFVETGDNGGVDILVAGCGTGRQSIYIAKRFNDAQVLAIDLSLTSLCYAQRQARALGMNNIRYAQANIMKLSSIGRSFDVIESSGVLHHLADPFAGWRELLALLKPGGVMQLGFYSELARQDIVAVRDFIAERGYQPHADDIRRCRQELLACEDGTPFKNVTLTVDFFSLSDCRDLLFHAQEHRLTLPQIAAFLSDNDLQFLGFDIDAVTSRNYARRFPADVAMTDLAQWHQYETENPYTFIQMYQFWIQRK